MKAIILAVLVLVMLGIGCTGQADRTPDDEQKKEQATEEDM